MSGNSIDDHIHRVIQREGGYVDHPADRGGPTKYGITKKTLSAFKGYNVSTEEVRDLSLAMARKIYYKLFWEAPGFHRLDVFLSPVVVEMVFDAAVHHGPGRAVKFLQKAVGTKQDGKLGPITYSTVREAEIEMIAARYMAARVHFIGKLITRLPSQAVFASGWSKRMAEFITAIPCA